MKVGNQHDRILLKAEGRYEGGHSGSFLDELNGCERLIVVEEFPGIRALMNRRLSAQKSPTLLRQRLDHCNELGTILHPWVNC